MNPEFWLDKWKNKNIGFHQRATNPYLTQFWKKLGIPHDSPVFVPLCGKSLDLLWLSGQGHPVLGVEVSELALNQFFSENGLPYLSANRDGFRQFESGSLKLLHGDFFNLTATHLQGIAAVYDRAAFVALPSELRLQYARHLTRVLPSKAKILLVTFEYDQPQMAGPPFSVDEVEVRTLYQDDFSIDVLFVQDVLENYPGFRATGLTALVEKVYLLEAN